MSVSLIPLTIASIRRITKSSVEVCFDIPEERRSSFDFIAGQYLTLQQTIDGQIVRRSYSLCRAPEEKKWCVAIKKIKDGLFSTYANDFLRAGDVVQALPPQGQFVIKENPGKGAHFVFFAAGSGITPILSMIRHLLVSHPDSRITLLYGNKNVESVMFREELEDLKNTYLQRLAIHMLFSREKVGIPILYGRIDKAKCDAVAGCLFNPHQVTGYYLCGPAEMIFGVRDSLQEAGVDAKNIHFELFTTAGLPLKSATAGTDTSFQEDDRECDVQIQIDGEIIEFSLGFQGQNLLDAAIDNGADLPYSCKGGVCSTCKAKVTQGEVRMDVNYALEPEEVAAGYVLLCQAHPCTESVSIDFDQK